MIAGPAPKEGPIYWFGRFLGRLSSHWKMVNDRGADVGEIKNVLTWGFLVLCDLRRRRSVFVPLYVCAGYYAFLARTVSPALTLAPTAAIGEKAAGK
jgi:hypothetical protein